MEATAHDAGEPRRFLVRQDPTPMGPRICGHIQLRIKVSNTDTKSYRCLGKDKISAEQNIQRWCLGPCLPVGATCTDLEAVLQSIHLRALIPENTSRKEESPNLGHGAVSPEWVQLFLTFLCSYISAP